jgi:hypothetical protein
MKRFARTITLAAATVLVTGLAIAQEIPPKYIPAPIQYGPPPTNQLPNKPTLPPVAPLDFPTGIQVGPGTLSPTFNPPGLQYTMSFD